MEEEGVVKEEQTEDKDDLRRSLSYLGECYVQLELAKNNYMTLRADRFYFDFLGQNGCKIEVKTALPSKNRALKKGRWYEYRAWQFRLSTEKQHIADFFVYTVFEEMSKPPIGYFIIPQEEVAKIGPSNMLVIFESDLTGDFKKENKINRHRYLNKWEQILTFSPRNKTSQPTQNF